MKVATALMVAVAIISATGIARAAQPTLGGGGTTAFTEGDGATAFGQSLTVANAGTYGNGYLDFAVSSATSADVLALTTNGSPVTTSGIVSIVGTTVYLGNGSSADPIGSVDATRNGANGVLRINFSSEFTNGGFETGTTSGWTVMNQNINLGVTVIAGRTSQDTSNYSTNSSHVNQDNDAGSLTYTTTVVTDVKTEGSYAVRLFSEGNSLNGYDVVHGPAIYSSEFQAGANDVISFDWRAFYGRDNYHVFGYILNTATGAQTEVIDATGSGSTSWATRSVTIPTTGTYRFVFVSGSYDASGGRLMGASLYIDNVQVFGSRANDAVVQQLARKATYRNTSENPPTSRTVTISARSGSNETGSTTETIAITAVNDAPTLTNASTSYADTSARDDFPIRTGTLTATDPDSGSFTYGITGGTDDGTTVTLTRAYGTLAVTKANGNWTFTPDDDAINALTGSASDTYPITASDGTDTGTATFTVQVSSAVVDVAGAPTVTSVTPGDRDFAVVFTAPADSGDAAISDYEYSTDNGSTWRARQDGVGTASPLTITTLSSDGTSPLVPTTAYDIRLRAVNVGGNGVASAATSATAVAVPSAPTSVVVAPSNGAVTVTWSAPSANGSAILDYTVTGDNGAGTCTTPDGSTTTCTFSGLTNGTTYSFTVTARNAVGASGASSAETASPFGAFMPTQALELRTTVWRPLADFMTAPEVPRLEGFTGENRVILTATNATVRITATSGLDPITGYQQANWTSGAASIGFTGTQSEINAALATLEARGVTPGSAATIDLDISSGNSAYDPSTGRFYEFVSTGVTWAEARCRAKYTNGTFSNGASPDECVSNDGLALQRRTLDGTATGLRGYLATVTSADENAFITGKVGTASAWLGGSDRVTEGRWIWADGPDADKPFFVAGTCSRGLVGDCSAIGAGRATYNQWNGGEPNQSGDEDALQILSGGSGDWNDLPATSSTMGYVIEYGGDGGTAPQVANESSAGTVRNTPTVVVGTPTLLTTTSARLIGSVNPNAETTTAEWTVGEAADLSDGQSSAVGGSMTGTSAISVPLDVSGLTPNTQYRFRLGATNTVGPETSSIATLTTLPPTPAGVTAASGDSALTVSWTVPTPVGNAAVTWTATASNGGGTCTASTTTCTITGLTNGTAYTVTVVGQNAGGTGTTSAPSAAATPATVPSAPTSVVVAASNGAVTVTWSAPSANGSAILDYTVTGDNGAGTCTTPDGSTTTCTFSGLTNGTTYSFTVTARNAVGASGASSAETASPFGAFMPTQALELRTTIWRPLADFMTAPEVPRLEGFTGENRVILTATNATVRITTTTGLDPITGYPQANWTSGAASIGFTGTQSEINAALATLEARGVTPGSAATIDLDISSGNSAYDPSTGRFYEFVSTGVTWAEARCRAKYTNGTFSNGASPDECVSNNGLALQRRTLGGTATGLRGYLATVTSADENAFITGKVGTASAWLGGSDRGHDKDWQWADGPDAGVSFFHQTGYNAGGPNTCGSGGTAVGGRYANWNTSEPNDWSGGCAGGEDALQILSGGTGKWNDLPATSSTMGYVIEYGGDGGNVPQTANESSAGTVRNTPTVTVGTPTQLTTTSARLIGSVNPNAETTTAEWTVGEAADLSDGQSSAVGGSMTGTSAISVPLDVSGLTPNTQYRFRLGATNTVGPETSSITTLTTLPPTPAGVTAASGDSALTVSWTVPTPVGNAAVTWTATASNGGGTCTASTTTCTITGLTNGTPYTVTVVGQNAGGTGTTSAPSAAATPATVPGAPTINGTPTYGDESAIVEWTAPASTGGAAITGYTVTASPGGQTCTWTSGPLECTVTGLANGTPHTFTVTATNSAGTGPASAASGPITPLGPPRAPTGVQAVAGIGLVTVTWAAPDDGGTPITGYTVTASPGGQTCTWASGPLQCVVTGLTNGVAYTFTVTATNAEGNGPASAATSPVTPQIGTVEPEEVEELVENSTNVSRGGDAQVAVACGVTVGTCETEVILRVGDTVISTTTGTLDAGASGTLGLDLPRDLQRQLARNGTLTVTVTITISSAAGTITVEVPLQLEAPPADRAIKWQGRPRSDGATDLTASCVGTLVSRCDGILTLYTNAGPARARQGQRVVVGTARVAGPAGAPIKVTARLNRTGKRLLRKNRTLRVAPEVQFEGSTTTDKIRPYRLRLMNERQWLQAAVRTLWVGGRPRLDLNLLLDQVRSGQLDRGRAAKTVERDILRRRQAAYRKVRALPAPPRRLVAVERDLRRAFEQSIVANRHYIAYLKTGNDNSWGAAWKTSKRASATKSRLVTRMQQAGRRVGVTLPPATSLWP